MVNTEPVDGGPSSDVVDVEADDGVGPERAALGRVDAVFFTFSALAAVWLGYLLVVEGVRGGWGTLFLAVFWVFFAYLLLPRLHRILTRLYVPGYFIGRARTSDGLLGDPVNLAMLGREEQLHRAMSEAGWILADPVDLRSSWRIIVSTVTRRSYREAPVSPLTLFDRQQDFAYQQEVAGSPSRRHHVRFWRCPPGWMLPGGYAVDWLAAGTYDKKVGLSLFTLQVTHKIESDIDVERDFIVESVVATSPGVAVRTIEDFSTGYHTRNGGGDLIQTDGNLPIMDLRTVGAAAERPRHTDSRDRRPGQTVFGAGVAAIRALLYVVAALGLLASDTYRHEFVTDPSTAGLGDSTATVVWTVSFLVVAAIVDAALAWAVLRGRNWARIWLMSVSSVSTILAFLSHANAAPGLTPRQLVPIAGSILVLLALSSHAARQFATRRSHPARARVTPEPSTRIG